MLTKEEILAAQDIKTQEVEVPEWGGKILVRVFSGNTRDKLMQHVEAIKKNTGLDATLPALKLAVCTFAMVDEQGNRMFTDEEMVKLGEKSSSALDKVYAVAEKINAVSVESAKAVEKN